MPIKAGELNRKVYFEKRGTPSAETAAMGTPFGDWEAEFSTFAKVQHLRGSEPVVQSRLEGRQPVVVTVRASAQTWCVTGEWRVGIPFGDECRYHNITAVTPHDDRTGIDFLCVYGGPVG